MAEEVWILGGLESAHYNIILDGHKSQEMFFLEHTADSTAS